MRAAILLAIAALIASPATAADWRLDPAKSKLEFVSVQQGAPFNGGFRRFTGTIRFDPAAPADARIAIQIDIASVFTGSAPGDQQAPGPDWFNASQFANARFETKAVRKLDGDRYQVDADLTIRDVSRPVSLPVTIAITGDTARAQGQLTIDRTTFGVGRGQFATGGLVGVSVEIKFDVAATKVR